MISPGAVVRDPRGELWVAHSQTDDGRRWKCTRRLPDGRFSCKIIGQGDLVEVTPAPEFEPGLSILVGGELHTVVRDLGGEIELRVPDRSRRLRGGDYLRVPGNTVVIAKSDLVAEGMTP